MSKCHLASLLSDPIFGWGRLLRCLIVCTPLYSSPRSQIFFIKKQRTIVIICKDRPHSLSNYVTIDALQNGQMAASTFCSHSTPYLIVFVPHFGRLFSRASMESSELWQRRGRGTSNSTICGRWKRLSIIRAKPRVFAFHNWNNFNYSRQLMSAGPAPGLAK